MAIEGPAIAADPQSPSDPIEGRLASPSGREETTRLATHPLVEEALEAHARDALGRAYYEHGAAPGSGYGNGCPPGRMRVAEGLVGSAVIRSAGRRPAIKATNFEGRPRAAVRAEPYRNSEARNGLHTEPTDDARRIGISSSSGT